MNVYLDIGAKRIQAYLARTPRLKARRGGSALLEHGALIAATKPAWWAHASVNDESKCTDGVLSLVFRDREVTNGTVDAVVAGTAALLNRAAPGAEWEIRISRAENYPEARRRAADAERAGQTLLAAGAHRVIPVPPAPAEVPVVRYCDCCSVDAAVWTRQLGAETMSLCADCTRRLSEGGTRSDGRYWSEQEVRPVEAGALRAERDLLDDVARLRGNRSSIAEEFQDLAKLGCGDANHLCTVFVDGNRFGDFFSQIEDRVSPRDLSESLTDAVRHALAVATASVMRESDQALPVVPHLIGGDDLLASVTADRAWKFMIVFLVAYHERTAELAAEYGHQAGTEVVAPTASAGLVFAHYKYPFATTLDLAEESLKRAKVVHKARTPAVCWVDVTEDGPVLPAARVAPKLAELRDRGAEIDRLVALPPSGQAELARLAGQPDAVMNLAHRLGNVDAIRPFLPPDPLMPIADALVLGRWWKCR